MDMRNSNILYVHRGRNPNNTQSEMSGAGFFSTLKSLFNKGKKVVTTIDKAVNETNLGAFGKTVLNESFSQSKYKTGSFPSERHPIIPDYDGRPVIASFLGPGTQFKKRVARGDRPVSFLDEYAFKHDKSYMEHQGKPKGIREADLKFIRNVKKDNRLSRAEKALGIGAIGGKVALEEVGINPYGEFSGRGNEGLLLPGQNLRKKIISQNRRKNRKQKNRKPQKQQGNGFLTGALAAVIIPRLIKKFRKR
jgi:hypothetical protein